MPRFVTGKELEDKVYNIFWEAQETLLIISPYIKLDNYFKKLFDKHINNHKLEITIVFGKNEGNVGRSFSKSDVEYFKNFPNISIVYVPNLHGKFYGNEKCSVVTSINLYDYSFINNIEFGVYSEVGLLDQFTTSADKEAWETCINIAQSNEVIYARRPVYEKKLLSAILGKNYVKSDTVHDDTERLFSIWKKKKPSDIKLLSDFDRELTMGFQNMERPQREPEMPISDIKSSSHTGFCIRTGIKIPFNLERPYSDNAFKSWNVYKNPDYKEKYCHKTGKASHGKTSKNNPILQS